MNRLIKMFLHQFLFIFEVFCFVMAFSLSLVFACIFCSNTLYYSRSKYRIFACSRLGYRCYC